jgi:signal transduction histidine kinase
MTSYSQQEEVSFFIADTNLIFEQLKLAENIDLTSVEQSIQLPFPLDRYFSAKVINLSNTKVCKNCQFIKNINNINYYQLEEGESLAEFNLSKSNNKVLIYERLDSERSEEELSEVLTDENTERVIFFSLIFVTLLLLGLTIYWPIKNLQRQIQVLINSHQQFGLGKMTIKTNENIQKPLDKLAQSFNNMALAIADNVKERDIFSQAIPHEVRTPLARIQLASGLIRKKSTNLDVLALVDDVDNYVIDINELINQIVEYSRINENNADETAQYQTIEIKAFVQSRLKLLTNNLHQTITLVIDESVEITTNPFYLRLLVDNFIKNALNHADEKIKLSANVTSNQLSITIEDDGNGVPADARDTIFIPFARLDKSRSRKTGGLGLGLPIAKAAATKMVGNIKVSKSPLGGAMFSFTSNIDH